MPLILIPPPIWTYKWIDSFIDKHKQQQLYLYGDTPPLNV